MPFSLNGYYAILDLAAGGGTTDHAMALLEKLLFASPTCLQLRAKNTPPRALAALARSVKPRVHRAGVLFCLNDRLDVALAVGADAVHLGQDDLPLPEARRVAAGRLAIGVSTHNEPQARSAIDGGADYVGLGPIFRTRSKANPDPMVGLDVLARVCAFSPVPVVAIGGISPDTAAAVANAGAWAAAVIGAVNHAPDPAAAGRMVALAFPPWRSPPQTP